MFKSIDPISYSPLHNSSIFKVHFDGHLCRVWQDENEVLSANVEAMNNEMRFYILSAKLAVEFSNGAKSDFYTAFIFSLDYFFSHYVDLKSIRIKALDDVLKQIPPQGFLFEHGELKISRIDFYQLSCAWHREKITSSVEQLSNSEKWTVTEDRKHPVRTTLQEGLCYRRYIPSIAKTLTFRTVDIERDLEKFYNWHNQPRVYDLWDLNKSKEDLKVYLTKGLQDPHQIPMIMEFDGEPAGYFEVYWAAEDRLAPYYDYQAYDRGFHFLIGEPQFLGSENTGQAVRSIMHFIFLDDPRSMRVVAEPRSDNKKVLKYVQLVPGWRFIKEFDFPHKRAALLMANREDFFGDGAL